MCLRSSNTKSVRLISLVNLEKKGSSRVKGWYFGGTLLGTGGLVRAYGEAAARALKAAARVRLVTRHLWEVRVAVGEAGRLEAELRGAGGAAGPAGADLTSDRPPRSPPESLRPSGLRP